MNWEISSKPAFYGRIAPCVAPLAGRKSQIMTISLFTHPLVTFVVGILLGTGCILMGLNSCASSNQTAANVAAYKARMDRVTPSGLAVGSAEEKAAIGRFKEFLQKIGDQQYVRDNTHKVYSADAYLDDTLVVHHGSAEIEAYFLKTSQTMTSYQVSIDDVAKSGNDYYVRWTMIFSAPALSSGKPIHSIGISQIRFNREGKVECHQDFWDSGKNFYAHLPVVGGAVGFVKKRLESN
jgi:SnoaL-like domain